MHRWEEKSGDTGDRVTVGQVGVSESEMTGDVVV